MGRQALPVVHLRVGEDGMRDCLGQGPGRSDDQTTTLKRNLRHLVVKLFE
jgi:hypothetical protein